MANVFEEQAKDRFQRASAFLRKSHALIQDDLIYRSALADAVSAIKNMLQGYLLLRIATEPSSVTAQQWQETAASNRMPDLLHDCAAAGLDLRGLEYDIKRLNSERNQRTHDDPQRLVDHKQAEKAIRIAETVRQRINAAVKGAAASPPHPAPANPAPVPAAGGKAGLHNRLPDVSHPPAPARIEPRPATHPVPDEPHPEPVTDVVAHPAHATEPDPPESITDALTEDADDMNDGEPVAPVSLRRAGRIRRALVRTLVAAALLIAGVAGGVGLMVPVATGTAPSWLSFAADLIPPAPTHSPSVVVVTPTPSPAPAGPFYREAAIVSAPVCQAGVTTLQMQNTGKAALSWAASGTGTPPAQIALAAGGAARPAQFGAIRPRQSVTLFIRAAAGATPTTVIITLPDGALEVAVPACP